jgi:arylsulfatase A-like enzyme
MVADAPVIGSDFFPTVLRQAGVPVPAGRVLDGVDVFPVLTGRAAGPVERLVPMYWRLHMAPHNLHIAMRQGDWKVLASADFAKAELYNLKDDPRETTDLADREPERLARMKKELAARTAEIDKEGPDWWRRLDPNGGWPPGKRKAKKK